MYISGLQMSEQRRRPRETNLAHLKHSFSLVSRPTFPFSLFLYPRCYAFRLLIKTRLLRAFHDSFDLFFCETRPGEGLRPLATDSLVHVPDLIARAVSDRQQ